jgi:hypothetical protein
MALISGAIFIKLGLAPAIKVISIIILIFNAAKVLKKKHINKKKCLFLQMYNFWREES